MTDDTIKSVKKIKLLFKRDVLNKPIGELIFEQVAENDGSNMLSELLVRRKPRLVDGKVSDESFYEYVSAAKTKEDKAKRMEEITPKFVRNREIAYAVDGAKWRIYQNKKNFFKAGETYSVPVDVAERLLSLTYKGINIDNSNIPNPEDAVFVAAKGHPQLRLETPIVEKVA